MRADGTVGQNALKSNPALEPLSFLIGEWRTVGRHPEFPGKEFEGRSSFEWHEGGAFLLMRTEVDHPDFPDGVAIIGSNQAAGTFAMIYFDERQISRTMQVTVGERCFSWHRDDPDFAQSCTITAEGDDKLTSTGRMSKDGEKWSEDLSQTFFRQGPAPATTC